jgi:glycine/D-amino acid oxidase-like deaminating enzyme
VIYARETPPSVTSNVAGGLWDPVSVYDRPNLTPEFQRQFGEASRLSFRRYQSLAGDLYGVRWLPLYTLSRDGPVAAAPPESPYSEVQPLYPEARQLSAGEHPFDVPFAHRRYSMLIEPAIYLNALTRDYLLNGGRIVIREFQAREELMSLRETLLFNCTGLGAGKLFGDAELMPIRGQLSFLLPQPEVEYMTVGPDDIYMFPRHDGVLLGGSHERGVWSTEPDPATTQRILRENGALFGGMRG